MDLFNAIGLGASIILFFVNLEGMVEDGHPMAAIGMLFSGIAAVSFTNALFG
ncbi:hypothetical protein PMW_08 [Pseudomonas phage phiPMW]|uniref:Uncharacterized protein n=1 Tax=Pseudomonas phage phiPMW TaxID=1815582 RepID=A0A1S5R146_9CAUD|nr:hypothetical protein FDG97_gp008 [Pseudomonas phage phiPMW]ANA49133.1 hypothetical protein PMW_08 [Pseudomonas phage phiPMW]